jgi:uncharacterized protein YndB with AHSA1/START domain
MTPAAADRPVRKNIIVKASQAKAFRVFTEGMDTWWPREHHIGGSPMIQCVLEGKPGGRCYSRHSDGSEAEWGTVLVWDPPQRLIFAWQVTETWKFEPDVTKSSEVEVQFIAEGDGMTRVELEHRHLERYGDAMEAVRNIMESPTAWSGMLQLFAAAAEK